MNLETAQVQKAFLAEPRAERKGTAEGKATGEGETSGDLPECPINSLLKNGGPLGGSL